MVALKIASFREEGDFICSSPPRTPPVTPFRPPPLVKRDTGGELLRVNAYQVLREIGKGTLSTVYLCAKKKKLYAIKVMDGERIARLHRSQDRLGLSMRRKGRSSRNELGETNSGTMKSLSPLASTTDLLEMSLREIDIMSQLKHPNVIQLVDVIHATKEEKATFAVMEYASGGASMIWDTENSRYRSPATDGAMSESTSAILYAGILRGLAHLHGMRIVHRDMKPDNILLTEQGLPKISDFGSAMVLDELDARFPTPSRRSRGESMHSPSSTGTTWSFWAPERCSYPYIDVNLYAADRWATGIILWCFLFEVPPFQLSDGPSQLFHDIANKAITFPLPLVQPCGGGGGGGGGGGVPQQTISPEAQDLLQQVLRKNAAERLSIEEMMHHPFTQVGDRASIPIASRPPKSKICAVS